MLEIKTIYFSHSKPDYDTEYELNIVNQIKMKYPNATIINPKDIKVDPDDLKSSGYPAFMKLMQKYYFPEIDKCDLMIIAKSKSGKYGSGVLTEIKYAKSSEKEVYTLKDECGNTIEERITKIIIEDLDISYPNPNRPTINCYWCKEQILEEDKLFCGEDENGDGRTYGCEYCSGV